jgi:hypothetical protein
MFKIYYLLQFYKLYMKDAQLVTFNKLSDKSLECELEIIYSTEI